MVIMFILFLTLMKCFSSSNLIWGEDFQSYNGPWSTSTTQQFWFIKSNLTSWYNINLGYIQIKHLLNIRTTIAIDLSNTAPYTVCHNFSLIPGRMCRLNYTIYCDPIIYDTNLTVWLNGDPISTLYVPRPNSFANGSTYFEATQVDNQLCFNQNHSVIASRKGNTNVGGLLDNITLYIAQVYNISFTVDIQELTSTILLSSDFQYNQELVNQFQNQYFLSVQGIALENCTYNISSIDNTLLIIIGIKSSFSLQFLQFTLANSSLKNRLIVFNLSIKFSQQNSYFHALNSNELNVLAVCSQALNFITMVVSAASSLLKLSASSYFIFNLMTFQNLSLFYIFLNFKSIPNFTKQIYDKLLAIAFLQEGVSIWIQRIFKLSSDPLYSSAQKTIVQQLISESGSEQMWFGSYGFSSLLLNNNSNTFLALGFLVLKLIFVKIILTKLAKQQRKFLGIKDRLTLVFVVQFISSIPSFIISAVPRMINSTFIIVQKIEKAAQLSLIFCCMYVLGLYFILVQKSNKNAKPKSKLKQNENAAKQKNNCKQPIEPKPARNFLQVEGFQQYQINNSGRNSASIKLKKVRYERSNLLQILHQQPFRQSSIIKVSVLLPSPKLQTASKQKSHSTNPAYQRKNKAKSYSQVTYSLLIFTIPFLISLKQTRLFLVVNSVIIAMKTYLYLRACSPKNRLKNIIQLTKNLVWITHHISYTIFYIIDEHSLIYTSEGALISQTLGIVCILTVLIGCVGQLIMLLLQTFFSIRGAIKKVYKMIKKKGSRLVKKQGKCSQKAGKQNAIEDQSFLDGRYQRINLEKITKIQLRISKISKAQTKLAN